MTTSELLNKAAERVRDGWTQGDYHNHVTNGVCVIGALCEVSNLKLAEAGFMETSPAVEHLTRVMGYDTCWDLIEKWNDAPGQTQENVANGLELAALLWDEEQKLKAMTEEVMVLDGEGRR